MLRLSFAALLCAQTSTTSPPSPFVAKLDDPMLAPIARAPIEVESWEEARRLLEERSTDLGSAMGELQRAEGLWRQALSALLPNAGVTMSLAVDALHPEVPPIGGGGVAGAAAGAASTGDRKPSAPLGIGTVSLSQSIIDVAAWRQLSSASANEEGAAANLRDVRRRVYQGLAMSLIAVVAAERASEINRSNLQQALERAALTERTHQLGAATQLDVVRVRQDVAVARSALIEGDEQLRRTREALGLALGIDGEVGVSRELALSGLVEETRRQCRPLEEGELRSDLVAADARVEAAEKSRSAAKWGYAPALGLTSNLFGLTTDPGFGRIASWSIAAVLSFPLWEGGFREGAVEERSGALRQAEEAREALRRSINLEIARSRRGEEVAKQLMMSAAEARELAARTDAMTRRSFEIGRATSLELVQSAAVLRQAELNLALREFEWVQARIDAFLTEARCEG